MIDDNEDRIYLTESEAKEGVALRDYIHEKFEKTETYSGMSVLFGFAYIIKHLELDGNVPVEESLRIMSEIAERVVITYPTIQ